MKLLHLYVSLGSLKSEIQTSDWILNTCIVLRVPSRNLMNYTHSI